LQELIADAPPLARREDAPLVGRDKQLRRLLAAFDAAREEERCRVVTIVGEAGIGKTRLARELVASVGDDARVLVGRCVSYGEGATYLPLAEIVRQAAPEPTAAGIAALLADDEDGEQVAQRVAELTGLAEGPAAPGEAFWAVRRFVEALARERPVLLALDDVHWAEPTLLDLVEYLGEWAEGPILVLCLARPDLLETRPAWGGPTSTGFVVELEPLPADESAELLAQLADEPLAAETRARIVEQSGGNPLFAEQLLALVQEAPEVDVNAAPPSVEALIASRLDRLDARELETIRRAAVVGRRFTRTELQDLAAGEPVDPHLRELEQRRLIRPTPDAEIYRFHHVLLRDVAYRGIPKAARAELHERAAHSVDRRDGADELVGYHFEQAYRYLTELARPDEHAQELGLAGGERLGRAGIRAWKRADAPAARNLLSRAVRLRPDAASLHCELAIVQDVQGEFALARESLERAAAAAVAARDEAAELRARLELRRLAASYEHGKATELLEFASSAIPRLEAVGDDRSLGRAWLHLGHVRGGFHCEFGAWEEAARRAARHYARAGWSPSTSLGDLAIALFFGPAPVERAIAECHRLLDEYKSDRASEANVLAWLGALQAMTGEFAEGRACVAAAEAIHEELGHVAVSNIPRARAAIELLAGTPDAAVPALRETCERLVGQNVTAVLATLASELANVLCDAGSPDEAESWVELAERSTGEGDLDAAFAWRYAAVRLLTRRGAIEDAEQMARKALNLVSRTDALNRHADCLIAAADVADAKGLEETARQHAREALHLYERKGNVVSAEHVRSRLRVAATQQA
jgi:predicted ATPase